jgi:hypothetical protein
MTFLAKKKVIKTTIFGAALGVCRVKNRLIGDFSDFMREAQQTPRKVPEEIQPLTARIGNRGEG